jgi:hypothetical protein
MCVEEKLIAQRRWQKPNLKAEERIVPSLNIRRMVPPRALARQVYITMAWQSMSPSLPPRRVPYFLSAILLCTKAHSKFDEERL